MLYIFFYNRQSIIDNLSEYVTSFVDSKAFDESIYFYFINI